MADRPRNGEVETRALPDAPAPTVDGRRLRGVIPYGLPVNGSMGPPKSGKVRSVPLIDQAAAALNDLSRRDRFTDDDDLVFVSAVGMPVEEVRLRGRFYATLERAGLKRLRLHDLRHTFGTIAVQAFPLSDVKAFMGHADIATTMIYVHHVPQQDAADKLSAVVQTAQADVPYMRDRRLGRTFRTNPAG
jgi:integrase